MSSLLFASILLACSLFFWYFVSCFRPVFCGLPLDASAHGHTHTLLRTAFFFPRPSCKGGLWCTADQRGASQLNRRISSYTTICMLLCVCVSLLLLLLSLRADDEGRGATVKHSRYRCFRESPNQGPTEKRSNFSPPLTHKNLLAIDAVCVEHTNHPRACGRGEVRGKRTVRF